MKRHAGEARAMVGTKMGQAKQGFKDHVASWKDLQNLQQKEELMNLCKEPSKRVFLCKWEMLQNLQQENTLFLI